MTHRQPKKTPPFPLGNGLAALPGIAAHGGAEPHQENHSARGNRTQASWWRGLYPRCPSIWKEKTLHRPFGAVGVCWVAAKASQQQPGKIKLFFCFFRLHFSCDSTRHSPPHKLLSKNSKPSQRSEGLLHPKNQLCKMPQQREKGAKSTQSTQPFAGCLRSPLLQPSRNAPLGCTWHPAERFRCTHGGGLWTCNRLYIEPPYIRVDV